MSNNNQRGLISVLGEARELIRTVGVAKAVQDNSLIANLRSTAVEPVVLVDSGLMYGTDITPVLLSQTLDQYVVMYVSVASRYLNMGCEGAKAVRTLERLATTRDILRSVGTQSATDMLSVGLQSQSNASSDAKQLAQINDSAELSVGKIVSLTFSGEKGAKFSLDTSVRLQTKLVAPDLITAVFEANYVDLNPLTRIKLAGLGEMTAWEALTCSREIKAQEKVRMADKDNVLVNNFINGAKELGWSVATGEIPINVCSGVNIVSSTTMRAIETKLRGRFDNFKVREKFFGATAAMLMIEVDVEDEVATFYYRGLNNEVTLPFRWLRANSNKQSDLEPMIKDIIGGHVPSLR